MNDSQTIERLQSHAESLGHYQLAKRGTFSELVKFQSEGIDPYRRMGQHIFTFIAPVKGGYYYIAIMSDDEHFARQQVEDIMSDIKYEGIARLTKLGLKEKLVLTPQEERELDLKGFIRKYRSGEPRGITIHSKGVKPYWQE